VSVRRTRSPGLIDGPGGTVDGALRKWIEEVIPEDDGDILRGEMIYEAPVLEVKANRRTGEEQFEHESWELRTETANSFDELEEVSSRRASEGGRTVNFRHHSPSSKRPMRSKSSTTATFLSALRALHRHRYTSCI
jgi:hypothetical protein